MRNPHFEKLENMYHGAPISRVYEPRLRVGEGEAEVTLAVSPTFFHAAGSLHGSVYFKVLDDACFFAASSVVEDVFVVTMSFTTYLTRAVTGGQLTGRGKVVHAGRSIVLAEAVAVDERGREVGRGSGAFMRSAIALGPDIGYA